MNVPEPLQDVDGQDALVRNVEDDDRGNPIVVDFGQDARIDATDSRVIVVGDGRQLEFELPASASDVTVRNGVVTIEGDG
ncbi:hypothetical protein [Natronobacterium gregoryi]|uniref:Hsp20/alpha crystallin family protein n=2 Tax=Natronobacterium gregoryi TaxID=44930 RepID=L0AI49_NATGS|nr:hypothetical protein [Natronobacterium gregoryi]AFZ72847.1 hypothetical protein Natgr_1643 [Natronobacterium gregoryi SP2]ELY69665.1 hypothetical protein C490_07671 [Natronobacterium gregoryi SP2]PLK21924.1 hypothetical protein CYV19_02210 [Natronobacterium gregoryi SP2]SFI65649.1 hypothetical protein SAMN05443661_1039 [Natronobacterium gregoryi]